jgi:imidazolonepropionase-like amidohydrolase
MIRLLSLLAAALLASSAQAETAHRDLVITNARVMTVSHGTLEGGSVWIRDGKIAAVGPRVDAPADVTRLDAKGRYLTPGIIDAHAHIGMGNPGQPQDTNEYEGKTLERGGGPNQADLRIHDSIQADDYGFYLLLSSGQTSALQLPGSANVFGGQAAPMKLKVGKPREEMFIADAPTSMKIACDTPARVWKGRGVGIETTADVTAARRKAFDDAKAYMARKDGPVDLKLKAIADVLRGKTQLQMHCHEPDRILAELALAREYGYRPPIIHHATSAYTIAPQIAAAGAAVLGVTDFFGGAPQVADGIPWNIAINKCAGVRVGLHGEVTWVARRLTQEAGKIMRYGGCPFTRDEALALVTLNPAWMMRLDNRIGSIDAGKDADLVLWDGDPLSTYGRAAQVFIDGELYFDSSLPGLGLVQQAEAAR